MESSQTQRAIELLSAEPSRESLLALVSWLDLQCHGAPAGSLPRLLLARAVVAVGSLLMERHAYGTIGRTVRTAEAFALEPTEEHYGAYFAAATDSYPFGPGEGCYALRDTGYPGCEPGSGCSSGSGCLHIPELGETALMQAMAKELLPWLRGEDDPVARRRGAR